MKTVLLTIISVLVVMVVVGIMFVYTGSYNVAATSQDSSLMRWMLETTREESIDRRAENVKAPTESAMNDPKTIRIGFDHYNEMCIVCHGAPGVEPGEAREGLNPKPPLLARVAKQISTRELFWVIKNGIKMTGMPAWGPTHSDDKIWAMVAFVKKLPELTAEQYKVMQQQSSMMGHDDEHDHGHSH